MPTDIGGDVAGAVDDVQTCGEERIEEDPFFVTFWFVRKEGENEFTPQQEDLAADPTLHRNVDSLD